MADEIKTEAPATLNAAPMVPSMEGVAAPSTGADATVAHTQHSDQILLDPIIAAEPPTNVIIENHSTEADGVDALDVLQAHIEKAERDAEKETAEDGDVDMEDIHEYSDDGSEYQPEQDSPQPQNKTPKQPKQPAAGAAAQSAPKTPKTPKTPAGLRGVRAGRIDKSDSPAGPSNLRCPVKGCGQTFTGRNPRQSLWHHLKYYATRGLPDRAEFEKLHGEAHAQMKREAEPKGTPVERNRISSSDYRKKNPEKAKTSARLSNFRARARKKGLTSDAEVEEAVLRWEREWQDKQAKEASEYFSGILLSAFE
ncbi:hypothetical protein BZA77DRAFT_304190 [Pyronema omphalodes]|nr:hypothetical protein BZA77DRAFT_304190 [Pyronema omphalodes]